MNIPLDEVIHFDVITSAPGAGVSDADSTPTWEVFEEATDTPILTGNFTKRTSKTGNYRGTATLSAANGFEVGKFYSVVASATVSSVAGKVVAKSFRVVPAEVVAGYPKVDTQYIDGDAPTVEAGTFDVNVASIDANAITALALASDAVAEIQNGLMTSGGYTAPDNSSIAAIKAKTDNLPSDPADASDIAASLTTIAGYIDTEVAAIKAKTDLIPSSPAAVGSAMTLTSSERDSVADAFLDRTNGIEPGETPRQFFRKARAVLMGICTAAGVFKRKDGTTTSLTVSLDGEGARESVTDGTN